MRIGSYETVGQIGRGSESVVLRARSRQGGPDVAIKILTSASGPDGLAAFHRERRLLDALGAPGFVPLLESGMFAALERGVAVTRPFFVMPLLEGGTLRDRLRRGPLPFEQALVVSRQLAGALGRAHRLGIVHRDLKPENIFFDAAGRPVIGDLGLAKHFRRDLPGGSRSHALSATGLIAGTLGYMAPEQLDDASRAGPSSDVFALGVLLVECLAGAKPFPQSGPIDYLAAVTAGPRRALRDLPAGVPSWLEAVIERALAWSPADRFVDAEELRRALDAPAPIRRRRRVAVGALAVAATVGATWWLAPRAAAVTPSEPHVTVPAAERSTPSAPARSQAGWVGEALPRGMRRGTSRGTYLWDSGHGIEIEMVYVPPGSFTMGHGDRDGRDHARQHDEPMPHGFWIGRYPTTWEEWRRFEGSSAPDETLRRLPAVGMTWEEARRFCAWAKLELPTEAEWEKAARGTDARELPWGDAEEPERLNFENRRGGPTPVGEYENASPFGALDMAGNVLQWCEDAHGALRATRGGSWKEGWEKAHSWFRDLDPPDQGDDDIGLRPVKRGISFGESH